MAAPVRGHGLQLLAIKALLVCIHESWLVWACAAQCACGTSAIPYLSDTSPTHKAQDVHQPCQGFYSST